MNVATIERQYKILPVSLIDEPALPSRSTMSDEKMAELVASIKHIGLQQPIVVARTGDRYEVIAGHRRWHACHRAGLLEVPCLIYQSKTDASEAIQFAENRHREDLNAADEAIWFCELLERIPDKDVDRLAARLGEKRSYVEGRLLLVQGDPEVFDRLKRGLIVIGVAQALNKCTDERRRRSLLHAAIVGGATVAVVNGWLMEWKRSIALTDGASMPAEPSTFSTPVPQANYFTCRVCGGTNDVYRMVPINVHGDCLTAVLDKLLASYRGEA